MTPAHSPPRLVVLTSNSVAVYNGRKLVAFSKEPFAYTASKEPLAYTASEIEEIRVADYTQEQAS